MSERTVHPGTAIICTWACGILTAVSVAKRGAPLDDLERQAKNALKVIALRPNTKDMTDE